MHRNTFLTCVALTAAALSAKSVSAATVFLDTFDAGSNVDSQTDFESVYNVGVDRNGVIRWDYNTSSGVGGTGALGSNGGDTVFNVRDTAIAGFGTNRSFTLSMDLLIDPDADAGFDVNFFGYLTDTATPREQTTSKTPDLGEAINFGIIDDGNDDDGGYSIFINNTELAFWQVEPASDDTNSPSLFFTAVFTVEQDAGGLFDATLELTDNSGVLPVSVYSDSLLDISDPGLAGVGDLYAGFGGRARNGSGIEALDNFGLSVTAIPEPTALAAVGVLGAMSLRRRR